MNASFKTYDYECISNDDLSEWFAIGCVYQGQPSLLNKGMLMVYDDRGNIHMAQERYFKCVDNDPPKPIPPQWFSVTDNLIKASRVFRVFDEFRAANLAH